MLLGWAPYLPQGCFADLARRSMHFKLAILTSLARRPDGRGTLGDIRRDAKALTADEDQWEEQFPPLADIDILESGLVVTEGDELQITEVGRSLLHALGTITETSLPS